MSKSVFLEELKANQSKISKDIAGLNRYYLELVQGSRFGL